jgi:predicted P-loop ATPase
VTSDYVRAVGAKFLIGAIARLFRPGAKNDTCPILEGAQGALKSTALRVLAGHNFFTDDIAELGSKDSAMQTRGVWIIELSELDSMTRGETSRVKAFVSRQVDRIRPPYGRHVVAAPRECVFAGTTNKDCYLRDETGSRRFWPIRCGFVNIPDLTRDRDQLWAEARERYNDGETWWFDTNEMVTSAAEETQARYEGDPWDELISTWLVGSNPESVSVTEVLLGCIAKKPEHWVQGDKNRVGRSLVSLGWERRYTGPRGAREWRYYPKPQLGNGVPV